MKRDLRILLGETNNYHAVMVERSLKERYPDARVDRFNTTETILKAVRDYQYDITVVDFDFSEHGGLYLMQLIKKEDGI